MSEQISKFAYIYRKQILISLIVMFMLYINRNMIVTEP